MIKVLIVDDSLIQLELLTFILNIDPDIKIVGRALDGEEAIKLASTLKPDVITMDLNMPKLNGIEAIREIMALCPTPIIVISGSADDMEVTSTFRAIEAGAVAVAEKMSYKHDNPQELIQMVKLMSEIKVVHRRKVQLPQIEKLVHLEKNYSNIEVIAIGGSTGAPLVFQEIFKALPKNHPPILIVQHISPGFLCGFCEWIKTTTGKNIKIAIENEIARPNTIYLAPDGVQMGISNHNQILLINKEMVNGHMPSITFLFESVANAFGNHAIGILLTGMGSDGAEGLKQLKDQGALTIAQSKDSSVVYGMPAQAVKYNAATEVLSPAEISVLLNKILSLNT